MPTSCASTSQCLGGHRFPCASWQRKTGGICLFVTGKLWPAVVWNKSSSPGATGLQTRWQNPPPFRRTSHSTLLFPQSARPKRRKTDFAQRNVTYVETNQFDLSSITVLKPKSIPPSESRDSRSTLKTMHGHST